MAKTPATKAPATKTSATKTHLTERYDEEVRARFLALQQARGTNANATLRWMLDICERRASSELSAVVTPQLQAQWGHHDLSDPQQRHGRAGASYLYCRQVLDRLMAANHATTTRQHRRYISRNLIQDESGVTPGLCAKFWRANFEEIDAHNKDMGFADPKEGQAHNQWHYRPIATSEADSATK